MSAAVQSLPPVEPPREPQQLRGLRVLVVHEWLYAWAGAERCLDQILEVLPQADVLVGTVTDKMRREHAVAGRARETWVGRVPGARDRHRWFLPMHAVAFSTHDTRQYDLVVSISHALEKTIRTQGNTVHLCYCLTPPRFLWDMSVEHETFASPMQRLALRATGSFLRAVDRRSARRVDHFVSISRHVADRVRRIYGRESTVVYPPVAAKARVPARSPDSSRPFLLSLGRLVPYKRVDLAVETANRLGLRLVIGGDGPERERLERIAGATIEFRGEVSEAEAAALLSSCAAFVFCAEDDFGIAPVEANAHGAPVVAYGRGGARETIADGETGVLFQEQTVDSLSRAIEQCLARAWDEKTLFANAARFSVERFRREFAAAASQAVVRA